MKNPLLLTALLLGLATPALAQVNQVPQIGLNTANIRQNTYSAAILKLAPAATPTDFFCIDGSSTKTISIDLIEIAATGTGLTQPIYLNHNLGLDGCSGGGVGRLEWVGNGTIGRGNGDGASVEAKVVVEVDRLG